MRDILSDAQNDKENVYGSVSSSTIGRLIAQLWGDKVRLVKRGSRNQRQNFYLNQKKNSVNVPVTPSNCTTLTSQNKRWQLVGDQGTMTSFIRFFPWSFKNQRGTIALRIEKVHRESSSRHHIASHGCVSDITDMVDERSRKMLPYGKSGQNFPNS